MTFDATDTEDEVDEENTIKTHDIDEMSPFGATPLFLLLVLGFTPNKILHYLQKDASFIL